MAGDIHDSVIEILFVEIFNLRLPHIVQMAQIGPRLSAISLFPPRVVNPAEAFVGWAPPTINPLNHTAKRMFAVSVVQRIVDRDR